MSFGSYDLKIKSRTWARDSYGLYDYENNHYTTQTFQVSRPGRIARINNDLSYLNFNMSTNQFDSVDTVNSQDYSNIIAHCFESRGTSVSCFFNFPDGIKISSYSSSDLEGKFWRVVEKGDDTKGSLLKVNDVIKFGRIMFKIRQVHIISEL